MPRTPQTVSALYLRSEYGSNAAPTRQDRRRKAKGARMEATTFWVRCVAAVLYLPTYLPVSCVLLRSENLCTGIAPRYLSGNGPISERRCSDECNRCRIPVASSRKEVKDVRVSMVTWYVPYRLCAMLTPFNCARLMHIDKLPNPVGRPHKPGFPRATLGATTTVRSTPHERHPH